MIRKKKKNAPLNKKKKKTPMARTDPMSARVWSEDFIIAGATAI